MSVRKIVKFPEKVLLNKVSPVAGIDDEIKILVKDMLETMYLTDGVGLSANQVGVSKEVAVMNPTGKKEDELILINPVIVKKSGTAKMEEGCLSMPGISAEVKRAVAIEVKFLDLKGKPVRLKLKGLPARIIQHELDHLSGFLFVDRIPFFKRKSLLKTFKRIKRI